MNNIFKKAMVASIIAVFVFSAFAIATDIEDAYAEEPIIVTDSTGKELILDAPADKVATIGYGFTKTVVDLGGKDKIVAYDLYSKDLVNEEGIEGKNVGSSYSSNKDQIYSTMVQLKDKGDFDIDTDVIIINDYSGTVAPDGTREMLEDAGFKVLCFGASSYSEVVSIVENIAIAIGKESSEALNKMHTAYNTAVAGAEGIAEEDKVTAIYVNEYQGSLRIYNEGIATSMIELAGGKNVGFKSDSLKNFHEEEASYILQLNPDVILLDGNHSMTEREFQKHVLKTASITVIKMDKDWNNYCPSAADGLLVVSEAMLNDYDRKESIQDILYINGEAFLATGMAIILVLAGILVMRRP